MALPCFGRDDHEALYSFPGCGLLPPNVFIVVQCSNQGPAVKTDKIWAGAYTKELGSNVETEMYTYT